MKKGFTVIELIISIIVLSMGVVGVYSAFSIMAILTSGAADRLTATYLAQEGVEIIRNMRDTNWIDPTATSWTEGFSNCASGCEADYKTGTGSRGTLQIKTWPIGSPGGDYLYISKKTDISKGFYSYPAVINADFSETRFKRKIIITCLPLSGGDCSDEGNYIIKIISQVSWNQKANIVFPGMSAGDAVCSSKNCIETEEILYNWF